MLFSILLLSVVVAVLVGIASSRASDNPGQDSAGTERDNESLIANMVQYAMPAPQHRLLDRMAGKWKTSVKYKMSAGSPVVESEGGCEREWILGNRFLREEFDGGDLALPFKALAVYGYDRFEKKYTSVWIDSLNTAITTYLGTCEQPCDVINFVGTHGDPWTGVKRPSRGVTRFVDDKTHVVELYEAGRDGREFKILEVTYTRE
jgi:hypothetical protein